MIRRNIYRILFALSCILFVISLSVIISNMRVYRQGDEEYGQVAAGAVRVRQTQTAAEEATGTGETTEPEETEPEETAWSAYYDGIMLEALDDEPQPALLIDFDELSRQNADVVAWIDFPGQSISYPVVQAGNNETYLNLTFAGTRSSLGSIFLDYRNDGIASDGNTIIYGHNMRNGSMFGTLKKYMQQDHYEEFPYFDIYTPEGTYRCRIITCAKIYAQPEFYRIAFEDGNDWGEYIAMFRETENYDTSFKTVEAEGKTADEVPRLVELSTCTGSDHSYRFAVLAQVSRFYPAE